MIFLEDEIYSFFSFFFPFFRGMKDEGDHRTTDLALFTVSRPVDDAIGGKKYRLKMSRIKRVSLVIGLPIEQEHVRTHVC